MFVNFANNYHFLKKRPMYSGAIRLNLGMKSLWLIIALVAFSFVVSSHVEDKINEKSIDVDVTLKTASTNYVLIASAIAGILVFISIAYGEKIEKMKMLIFLGIIIPIIFATAYLGWSTIYLNLISETKGPVHWHSDFEIWNCGLKLDFIDATGFSNRVGNPVFHEHGDDRIHVEGVVVDSKDFDLHSFIEVMGGSLDENSFKIKTTEGNVEMVNGDLCKNNPGKLQAFLYKVTNPDDKKNWVYEQQKLENFKDNILAPFSNIPPGDCIIIEFDIEKEKTEHICETYKVAIERGDLSERN